MDSAESLGPDLNNDKFHRNQSVNNIVHNEDIDDDMRTQPSMKLTTHSTALCTKHLNKTRETSKPLQNWRRKKKSTGRM